MIDKTIKVNLDKKELDKLRACVHGFQEAMLVKLWIKYQEGFYGWNQQKNKKVMLEKLKSHFTKLLEKDDISKDDFIDIANFCMFLWNLESEVRK